MNLARLGFTRIASAANTRTVVLSRKKAFVPAFVARFIKSDHFKLLCVLKGLSLQIKWDVGLRLAGLISM